MHNDTSKGKATQSPMGQSATAQKRFSKVFISFPDRGGGNPSPEIFRSHFKVSTDRVKRAKIGAKLTCPGGSTFSLFHSAQSAFFIQRSIFSFHQMYI